MFMRCGLAIMVAVVLLSVPLGAADNPVGLWIGKTEVPGQGPDQVTLTITKTKDGYGGTMIDSLGQVAKEDLREVKFADGVLTFSFSLSDSTQMTMQLKLTGDTMTGEWRHPEGDAGAITFERKKA